MSLIRVSLEQWIAFVSVVREDGYLNASLKLNKTQPSISYSIQKIEQLLNTKLFEPQGRKSVLTNQGRELYVYAARLVQLASDIEQKAKGKINKIEHKIRLAVDEIFPIDILMRALTEFSASIQDTTVTILRGILSGPCDMLEKNEADIAITYKHPKDVVAELFYETTSAIFASPHHRLHLLNRTLTQTDLLLERQIIVMDSNQNKSMEIGWLNYAKAWYVDSLEMKLQMLVHGLGFAWLNENLVTSRHLPLATLDLDIGSKRSHKLYLAYRSTDKPGEASSLLIELLKKQVANS